MPILARLNSASAGLAIIVGALLLSAIVDNRRFVARWFRDGLLGPARDGGMAASVFIFIGVIVLATRNVAIRSLDVKVNSAIFTLTNLVAFTLFGYGVGVWSASLIAQQRGPRVARVYLWTVCGAMLAGSMISAGVNPFHPPRVTAAISAAML